MDPTEQRPERRARKNRSARNNAAAPLTPGVGGQDGSGDGDSTGRVGDGLSGGIDSEPSGGIGGGSDGDGGDSGVDSDISGDHGDGSDSGGTGAGAGAGNGDDGDGRGSDNRRRSGKRKPRSSKAEAEIAHFLGADSLQYTVATQMLMDFLKASRGDHFEASFEDCEAFGEALQNVLKNPKYHKLRKNVDSIIGPLMLASAAGKLVGPGIKHELEQARIKHESAKASRTNARELNAAPNPAQSNGAQSGDIGGIGGGGDFADVQDGITGSEHDYI